MPLVASKSGIASFNVWFACGEACPALRAAVLHAGCRLVFGVAAERPYGSLTEDRSDAKQHKKPAILECTIVQAHADSLSYSHRVCVACRHFNSTAECGV
jgi:hypothetical protein